MTDTDAEKILMFMLGKHGYIDIMSLRYKDTYFLYIVEDENYAVKSKIVTMHSYAIAHSGGAHCIILEQITSKSNNYNNYAEMLESLLDACKRNDIYIHDNKFTLFLKKGTTLEQLKIKMDLEADDK